MRASLTLRLRRLQISEKGLQQLIEGSQLPKNSTWDQSVVLPKWAYAFLIMGRAQRRRGA